MKEKTEGGALKMEEKIGKIGESSSYGKSIFVPPKRRYREVSSIWKSKGGSNYYFGRVN